MNAKLIGVIVLVVIGIGALVFSLKSNFMGGPPRAGLEQGLAIKKANEAAAARHRAGGGGAPATTGPGAQTPRTPGAPGTP